MRVRHADVSDNGIVGRLLVLSGTEGQWRGHSAAREVRKDA
jgi:hypothetical protein